ncbi:Ribosomal protein S18 acetylase RimI [Thalassolituus maritimus]|uniref:Ribosomal protein S18 acetylase RimI n=1 Tax=Thalassolituus maritimus TaxID=484498 RepID=A0A1N7Q9H9_9GAMM|nr:GNAT family N-acetyltransferase [Thalassolituus maritimus]SIT19508.1 Ribosomal protein S18 acetylase RimI [Thalassolituus maritimus]
MNIAKTMFKIAPVECLEVDDATLSDLLNEVFVNGGFTSAEIAPKIFNPAKVRERGFIVGVFDESQTALAGIIIVVPPGSSAQRLAQGGEAELHLLAVLPQYRRQGIGRLLVSAGIEKSIEIGCSKLILWTQPAMTAAQRLYESLGFVFVRNMSQEGREFKVYERALAL